MEAADAKVILTRLSVLGKVGRCQHLGMCELLSARQSHSWGWGWVKEEVFEGVTAAEVEEEEVFEVDGADALGGVICEHWEGEGEEVQGDADGNTVEVVFSSKGVGLEGACRGMGEEEDGET
ncbi:hypothetical protein K439DRAFT_1624186 [Ramaria rubella]|nr:hypothetical protein K439DRAFT_1624186 [Ramaria rubella]